MVALNLQMSFCQLWLIYQIDRLDNVQGISLSFPKRQMYVPRTNDEKILKNCRILVVLYRKVGPLELTVSTHRLMTSVQHL